MKTNHVGTHVKDAWLRLTPEELGLATEYLKQEEAKRILRERARRERHDPPFPSPFANLQLPT